MTDLVISNLQSSVPGLAVQHLEALDLTLREKEIIGLNGPSGSGKSLLLRAIADLDPSGGDVLLGNQSRCSMKAHEWRKKVCYLPTESAWWFETVGEHFPDSNADVLQKLGFEEDVLDWKVSRLSSGEKQRLALARCLSRFPDALLLDEPTASLDESRTHLVEEVVSTYSTSRSVPVLWVSHDKNQLQRIAQYVLEIQSDGSIEEKD
jgi:ABC-type iron transport system FetAB ATPase subunit